MHLHEVGVQSISKHKKPNTNNAVNHIEKNNFSLYALFYSKRTQRIISVSLVVLGAFSGLNVNNAFGNCKNQKILSHSFCNSSITFLSM